MGELCARNELCGAEGPEQGCGCGCCPAAKVAEVQQGRRVASPMLLQERQMQTLTSLLSSQCRQRAQPGWGLISVP